MPTLTRALGVATAAYGAVIIIKPLALAKPCGLTTRTGHVTTPVRMLISAIGVRDAAIGSAMLCARPGSGARVALWARVASDVGDAVIFGLMPPEKKTRQKVALFAAGWAALCAAADLQTTIRLLRGLAP